MRLCMPPTAPRTIDVHTHIIPPALLAALRRDGARYGADLRAQDGREVLYLAGDAKPRPIQASLVDVDQRLAAMDRQGIDVQVLSTWIDLSAYRLPAAEGAAFSRLQNACIAEVVESAPARYVGSATVPLQAPEEAVNVLREAVDRLGFRAVQIATEVGDRFLDDPLLQPFWDAAEASGVLVLVHPLYDDPPRPLRDYFLANVLGNPFQTSMALARLIFGGVLQRHPRLKISFAHGGGVLPYQLGRVRRAFATQPAARARGLETDPLDLLRRCYFDTVLNSAETIRHLASLVGAQRLLLGSDYPFEMGDPEAVRTVEQAFPEGPERNAVLAGTLAGALSLV